MFSKMKMKESIDNYSDKLRILKGKIQQADAVIVGAGAGLSTSAGFVYNGERFERYFADFKKKYGFTDMYSAGFYPYETMEEHWGYWCRYIYINRYMNPPKNVYTDLYSLLKDKNYFVLTTNVDHCFQKAGFDKDRLFYTQGDYGLFQCSVPCHNKTYDNDEAVKKMVLSEGFEIKDDNLIIPENAEISMKIPSELVPRCPVCGKVMSMNLRADNTFVQDDGWDKAAERYNRFLEANKNKNVVFLELGVGYNTPGIIKYPFWQYTYNMKNAFYICINRGQSGAPADIKNKSLCLEDNIADVLTILKNLPIKRTK